VSKKLIVLTALALLSLASSAQIASAIDIPVTTPTIKSYEVSIAYGGIEGCKYDDEHASFRMRIEGAVKAVGMEKPSTIKVTYQVYDKTTKWTIASRAVTLKKSKGYKLSSYRYTQEAGHTYVTRIRAAYTIGGKKRRISEKTTEAAPTKEELATKFTGCS
jgi:hypothetical protein